MGIQKRPSKAGTLTKSGTKNQLVTQGSKMGGILGALNKGKSGLNLSEGQKKLLAKGSAILMRKLSATLMGEDIEEEDQGPPEIQLTLAQLEEDMPAKILEPKNPVAPKVYISYNYIEKKYERNEIVDQLVMHFQCDGETIIKESEEHKIQEEMVEIRDHLIKETVKQHDLMDFNQNFDLKEAKKILRNKFNYSERMAQTPVKWIKERGVSTAKPK